MTTHDQAALTPKEIVAYLWDAGWIARGLTEPLEQRITACAEQARNEGRLQAITEALDRAEQAVKRTKGERQRAVAQQVLSAVKALLPEEEAMRHELTKAHKQGYGRGFRDGKESADKAWQPRERSRTHRAPRQ